MELQFKQNQTPFFLFDEKKIISSVQRTQSLLKLQNARFFYPLKTQNLLFSLNSIKDAVDGFAVSSLFETRLAREIIDQRKKVHFTSPGLRDDDFDELLELCDSISFNSLSQFERYRKKAVDRIDCALRINPQLSFVKDKRYDPSRKYSRLGIPLSHLKKAYETNQESFMAICGLHFHSNCDAEDFSPLLQTVKLLDKKIPDLLKQCQWINLGGGYLFDESSNLKPFELAIQLMQEKYQLEVILEPGASVVRNVCYLVASIIDIISSDGKKIAVLDTTVNHMPEVFEYQFKPDILNESENGKYSYILEGSTCLAGDHFGEYTFDKPLQIGSKIIFTAMGSYTIVKAHTFNGINLPSVYSLTEDGNIVLQKQYTYDEFRGRCGAVEEHENIRKTSNNRNCA